MLNRLRFLPSLYEMVGFGFLSLLIMVAANSRQLLSYYGLDTSGRLVQDGVSVTVGHGLSKLDQFSVTASVVTFAVWALIGLICFSVVNGIGRVFRELEFDKELSSNWYVHPSTFRRGDFWLRVLYDFLLTTLAVVILTVVVFVVVVVLLPIAITYGRLFLLQVSLPHVADFLIGSALIYFGLLAVDIAFRFLLFRRHLLNRA